MRQREVVKKGKGQEERLGGRDIGWYGGVGGEMKEGRQRRLKDRGKETILGSAEEGKGTKTKDWGREEKKIGRQIGIKARGQEILRDRDRELDMRKGGRWKGVRKREKEIMR